MQFHFEQPQWLWMGALVCAALVALSVRAARLRRRALVHFAGARAASSVSAIRRLAKQVLTMVGLAAVCVALARPVAGYRWEETRQQALDLMFAVDTSKSMRATDLRPDRLTRAKLAVNDLVRKFPGERLGLIAFAGEAFVQAPLTTDAVVFQQAVDALDTDVIPRGGTDIASAIRTAEDALASEPARRKLLVILSDGEDLEGNAITAATDAARKGLVIYTVGVGSPQGALIPIRSASGQEDLLRDASGQPVRSHLDENTLRRLAQITGGAYAALGPGSGGLQMLYRQHLANLPRHAVQERLRKVYTERFAIPLAVALGCLLLALVIDERRRSEHRSGRSRAVVGAAAVLVVSAALGAPARAAGTPAAAKPASAPVTYNEGTTAYRKRDFAAARGAFEAATRTRNLRLQADAYYDLGNARYRVGQGTLAKDPKETEASWKAALGAYDGVLALQPKDADARFNRDFVAKKLAELQQQQAQKDQQQKSGKSGQKNQQAQNGQGQRGQKDQQGGSGQQGNRDQQQAGNGQQGKSDQKSAQAGGSSSPGQNGAGQGQPPKQGAESGKQANQAGAQGNQPGNQNDEKGANQPGARPGQDGQPQPGATAETDHPRNGEGGPQPAASPGAEPGAHVGPGGGGDRAQAGMTAAERDERGAPGALTRGEAIQLLDSVAGELHRMPSEALRQQSPNRNVNEPAKDW